MGNTQQRIQSPTARAATCPTEDCQQFANDALERVLGPDYLQRTYFPHIYVIALDGRKERVLKTLSGVGIHPTPVDIVLKDQLPDRHILERNGVVSASWGAETDDSNGLFKPAPFSLGRVACHLSHLRALQMFLADPTASRVLVFEDDLVSKIDRTRLETCLQQNSERINEYDVFYLGSIWRNCEFDNDINGITDISRNQQILGRHAISFSRAGANIVLERTLPMTRPGDQMISELIRLGVLYGGAITNSIFVQDIDTYGTTLENNTNRRPTCMKPTS